MPNDTILMDLAVREDLNIGVGRVEVPAPSGGYVVGNKVNIASFAIHKSFTWTPGTIAVGGVASTTISVTGAALGYPVLVAYNEVVPIAAETDSRVQTANEVKLSIFNRSPGSPITLGALTGSILVFPIPAQGE